ncbi:MAG: triose-phosphate isomerase [Candidatus Methanoplasma sp.]|jgi:triosephosphate isomerase|nr:triose-phosphate isomerase [Candidatus Methanoplasma sp.]
MTRPLIVVNFKAYAESEGAGAMRLAEACRSVSEESGVAIAAAPPMVELGRVAGCGIPVFAQSVDPIPPGAATGWATPSMVKACGAAGTLVNHSEHRMDMASVGRCAEMSKACGLTVIICAKDATESAACARFAPEYVAVEPPELIGGDVSVTTASPKVVSDTVDAVRSVDGRVSVLCGAGVKTGEDAAAAVALGADGVLLASGVVKARDPAAVLRGLVGRL